MKSLNKFRFDAMIWVMVFSFLINFQQLVFSYIYIHSLFSGHTGKLVTIFCFQYVSCEQV